MRSRTGLLLVVVAAAAIAGAIVWQTRYSREAQIERAYDACIRQFGGPAPRQASAGMANASATGDGAPLGESIGKAMEDLVRGVTAGMSGAVCGAVREACRADFDGAVCRNARAGFG